jgi:hypothetical protein
LTPSPTHKVLSTFGRHGVRALLMGGQACILYGAAEFTRDIDFLIGADGENLERLRAALAELKARRADVPELDADALRQGHACLFRCGAPALRGWRIDVLARFRGCGDFRQLWAHRQSLRLPGYGVVGALAIEDLVTAKKTQRDKDWPMIARLVEADYVSAGKRPARRRIQFWLREARTIDLILALVRRFPGTAARCAAQRPAVAAALRQDLEAVERALLVEQKHERQADRLYWQPLRSELAQWRRARGKVKQRRTGV